MFSPSLFVNLPPIADNIASYTKFTQLRMRYIYIGKQLTIFNNNHLSLTDAATSHKEVPGSGNNHAASSKPPITSRSPFSPAPLTNAGSFASDPCS